MALFEVKVSVSSEFLWYIFEHFSDGYIVCLTQYHNAMEDFNKALVDKKYVDAAKQLEKVKAAYITCTQYHLHTDLNFLQT